jgi:hypothetical protein
MKFSLTLLVFTAFGVVLPGCQTDVSLPMMQVGLFYEVKDVEVMSQLCGRLVSQSEVNGINSTQLKFTDFSARRPLIGTEGKGSAKITYRPGSGAPACTGSMSFDFVQHATGSKFGKRAVKYESTFELKNLIYTK